MERRKGLFLILNVVELAFLTAPGPQPTFELLVMEDFSMLRLMV